MINVSTCVNKSIAKANLLKFTDYDSAKEVNEGTKAGCVVKLINKQRGEMVSARLRTA